MTASQVERAAMALATAAVVGDKAAAKEHGCSTRSLRHWRKLAETRPELAAACREKKQVVERDWAEELPGAIRSCIDYLKRAAESDSLDPDMVHSVAGALKILNETAISRRVLDARLARADRPVGAEPGQVAPSPAPGNVVPLARAAG